jgi:hypothetical protein
MASGIDFGRFPTLVLDSGNVSGSFRRCSTKYDIAIRYATLNAGKETVDSVEVSKFREESKLLVMLYAIGNDGVDVLESLQFDLSRKDNHAHYEAFNLYVVIMKRRKAHMFLGSKLLLCQKLVVIMNLSIYCTLKNRVDN